MKKIFLLSMLVLLSSPAFPEPPDSCHVQIGIDAETNDTLVLVPCQDKNTLIQTISSFLGSDGSQRLQLNTLMREKSGKLTLTITSGPGRRK